MTERPPRRVFAIVASLVALVATCGVGVTAAAAAPRSSAGVSLADDPAQHGYIGLCDEANRNVTSGSIDTKPFVWKAVSSSRPAAAFQGAGENAVLNIYQPRPGVDPAEWSGNSLAAPSFYSTRAHPTVQATYADISLRQFMRQFPPQVDGLYALRFYYGKANYGIYRATYPVTVIQVTGSRWKVVRGGTVSCASGKAVSQEQLTGVATRAQYTAHQPAAQDRTVSAAAGRTIASTPSKITNSSRRGGSKGSLREAINAKPAASESSSADGNGWLLWLVLGVGVLGTGALIAIARTRRASTSAPDTSA